MKKFYAFAAALFVSATALAQNGAPLYATGAGPAFDPAWSPASPMEFKYDNGVYTLELQGLTEIKISTATGKGAAEGDEWNVFNAGALTCKYGNEQGVEVALEAGDQNISAPWEGDYTVTVSGDLSKITLSTKTPKPQGAVELYLRGDMSGWGDDAASLDPWKLTPVEGKENVYTFVCGEDQMIRAGQGFKISTSNWSKINLGVANEGDIVLIDDMSIWKQARRTTVCSKRTGTVASVSKSRQMATHSHSSIRQKMAPVQAWRRSLPMRLPSTSTSRACAWLTPKRVSTS